MPNDKSASILNTILGPGSSFMGHIEMEGLVRIDGFYSGSLRTSGTVVISADARFEGPIRARSVVVGGIVKGGVYATEHVDLLPGAVVVGDVFSPLLNADESAVIHGDCRISGPTDDPEAALAAFMRDHGGFPGSVRAVLLDQRQQRPEENQWLWKR
jgi:cytoskeletal protein CcmA (bactofilin family)